MQIAKVWELYESHKRIEGFSPQTLKAYRLHSKLLIHHFNDVSIGSVSTDQLKGYLAKSSEHLKPSSLAHRIRFIKSLFRWSHEEGHIQKNPAAKIKEPKQGKRIPKFLTEREIEHLREACFTPMEKALFEFMFSTGCRIVKLFLLIKIVLIGQIALQLFLERGIRKGRFTLIYGVKSGSSDI
ncbi:site-specific recombinase XerD [Neobacillus niacini]|nr:site-specific recombinase XerD [Neobacillus niacini]